MLSRRDVVASIIGLTVSTMDFGVVNAQTIDDDPLPPLPSFLKDAANESDFFSLQLETTVLGKQDPGDEKKAFAKAIMENAPFGCRPIEVAYYYRDLGLGKISQFGDEGRAYARGWPRLYNPIIVEFFKNIGVDPLAPNLDGDATAWCAVFVNYCLARAQCKKKDQNIGPAELAFCTKSASSGSFRCFGSEVVGEPKVGDIAVWALEGSVHGCDLGKGHVGFYDGDSGDQRKPYWIMGGNQSGDPLAGTETRNDGMIRKKMPLAYLSSSNKYKKFLGFRTAPYL